jgi:hypothetical protein
MNKQYLIIGAVAVLLFVGGGVAMISQKGGDVMQNTLGGSVAKLFNGECRYNDPELCKFMNNWAMPSEYEMRSTITSKSGPTIEFVSQVDGDDTYTMMKDAGKVTHESMTVGDVDYIKDLVDNVWWKIIKEEAPKTPMDETVKIDYDFTEKMAEVEDKTTYVRLGTEACGSSTCYKYEIIDPENKGTKEFIWFDDEDYLMRKMRSEEQGGEMTVSEIETTYGNVTISAPSPVKEGTVLEAYGASAGMTKAEIAEMKKMQAEAEKANAEYLENMPEEMSY